MCSIDDREAIAQAYDALEAAHDKVAALSYAALTSPELRDMLLRRARLYRRQPAVDNRLIKQLTQQTTLQELGGTSWVNVLSTVLRISTTEARRRLTDAQELGPRTAISGEPLKPLLPSTARAQAAGNINAEHVRIIRSFFANMPEAEHAEM